MIIVWADLGLDILKVCLKKILLMKKLLNETNSKNLYFSYYPIALKKLEVRIDCI